MTLDQLKDKATASELTLIDAVESAIVADVRRETVRSAVEFIQAYPPPSREDYCFAPDAAPRWVRRLREHLESSTTDTP